MREENRYRIAELILKFLETKASLEEIVELQEWISLSEENRNNFQKLRNIWEMTNPSASQMNINIESALLKTKIRAGIEPRKKIVSTSQKVVFYFQRIAAILFLPTLIALSIIMMNDKDEQLAYYKASTPYGSISEIILPDSSKVWLDVGSTLEYPSRFINNTRRVYMCGEAYFEVAKDPEKKFILSTTHQSQIEVLGTCFNVEAYEQNTEVITTLIEGKVDFMFEKDAGVKHVFLSPREKLVYDSETDKVRLYKTSGKSELAWKDGEVVLDNTPLEEALWMLEKRYSVKFVIKNEKLKNSSFTGTFTNQRLEKILEYFKVSSKIRWQHINDDKDGSDRKKEIIEIY